ncbi:hypothetical protein GCM10010234_00020 [Streptomyces hawaiiensis]
MPVTWWVIVTDPPASSTRSVTSVLLSLEVLQERAPLKLNVTDRLLFPGMANRSFPEVRGCLGVIERTGGATRTL